jgi:hypothetical protein
MARNLIFKCSVFCLLCASVPLWLVPVSKAAELPVAPPPREIRPDGSRDAVPAAGPKENPAEVVDRIIKNSKDVGEKLAKTDTGAETRGTQKTILKDIDSLIDQQENPPPQDDMNKDNKDKKDMNKDDMPKDGKNDMPKDGKKGMNPMGGQQPKDGNQQSKGRKPRQGGQKGGQPPMPMGGQKPEPGMAQGNPMPMPMNGKEKDMTGGTANAGVPMGKAATKPMLPIDDSVVKEVWGHLPDKLRQQVTQYYKEEFMPKYSDLLKRYYSSLANAPQKP